MTSITSAAIVRRLHEQVFNASGDLAVIDEFVAEDYVDNTAPPQFRNGRASFRALAEHWRAAIPDIRLVVDSVVAEGDLVALAWRGTGTHLGELMGIPATGRQGSISGISISKVVDGRVVERWGNADDLGLLRRLGVVPA
jgi:predicted ester cyclase